jgi:hypothetical protein
MSKFTAAVLLGLFTGFVFPHSFEIVVKESGVNGAPPIFRVTVVGRTTAAINYRPRSGSTKVDLVATGLLPGARGVAEVSGKKGRATSSSWKTWRVAIRRATSKPSRRNTSCYNAART